MLLIGKLDRRINILEEVDVKNPATGEITNEWTVYKTLPCSVADNAFGEKVTGVEVINEESLFITIRYRDDIDTKMRLTLDGITYHIMKVMPLLKLGRKQGTIIACVVFGPGRGE